jgi:metallo-beta-lactamase class B
MTREVVRSPAAAAPAPSYKAPPQVTLAAGIHIVSGLAPSVAYFVETSEGLVLVDSGMDPDCMLLRQSARALNLDLARLKYIFLTHAHVDHVIGAQRMRDSTGAKVCAGRADAEVIRVGGPPSAMLSAFGSDDADLHGTEVDVELAGGEAFELGDTTIHALATPGHTPGSMCYRLERADGTSALFSGDTVMTLKQLGTYAIHGAPRHRGSAVDFAGTLRMLKDLPAPDLLLPGHPHEFNGAASVHISPDEWRKMIERGIAEVDRLLARRASHGADFLDGHPKEIVPGIHYLGDLHGRAVYALASPAGLVLFDAPGPGLVPFVEDRVRRLGYSMGAVNTVLLTSCEEEAIEGLGEMVDRTRCWVVASNAGLEQVRAACPPGTELFSEDELESAGLFEVTPVPLPGPTEAPMAYTIAAADQQVLVSGSLPLRLTNNPIWSEVERDRVDSNPLFTIRPDAQQYLDSLEALRPLAPDVWLPAVPPPGGQTANLYSEQWAEIIDLNEQHARDWLEARPARSS